MLNYFNMDVIFNETVQNVVILKSVKGKTDESLKVPNEITDMGKSVI